MKKRLILSIVLHGIAMFILQKEIGWMAVLGIVLHITANNIEQSTRWYTEMEKYVKKGP